MIIEFFSQWRCLVSEIMILKNGRERETIFKKQPKKI